MRSIILSIRSSCHPVSHPQVLYRSDDEGRISFPHIAAPERPEAPSEPLSTVPFLRDADIVDRGTLLEQVEEQCIVRPSRLALVGMGGVG